MAQQVEELLTSKGLEFIPAGRDFLIRCLNPEHEDNNPSLRLDRVTGIGHCFSCGFKLNIFEHFNIISDFQQIRIAKIREKIDHIRQASIGLAMPDNSMPVREPFRGISVDTLKSFGAFTVTSGEFENRIVFPIRDTTGKVKCFLGRHMFSDEGSKYLIRPAHTQPPLFNANVFPYRGSIVIVEGAFDALNLIDKGIDNVVAALGTNTLKKTYKEKLSDYKLKGVHTIYLMLDGDEAGRKAALELQPLIESLELRCEIIELEDGVDPGELTQEDVNNLKEVLWP